MTSRASSESTYSVTDSEHALGLLADTSALNRIMRDVECPVTAGARQRSLVGIRLSDSFNYLVTHYEVLRKQFCNMPAEVTGNAWKSFSHVSHSSLCDCDGYSVRGAARWLLLLSFLIRVCPSLYTAWKDRRDLLLANPRVALQASRDTFDALYATSCATDTEGQSWGHVHELAQQWLPARDDLCIRGVVHGAATVQRDLRAAVQGNSNTLSYDFSIWRTVRWELRCSARFVQLGHKNFQLWHHRKELLMRALASLTATQRAILTHSNSGPESFDQFLRETHDMSFDEIDECALTEDVLLNLDSKNYHVWLYRSWFVHAFGFLVVLPPLPVLERALTAARNACVSPSMNESNDTPTAPTTLDAALLPHCALARELNFTTRLLAEDCWNNSAWCHRLQLVRDDLILGTLQQVQLGATGVSDTVRRVLDAACVLEWRYALSYAVAEPANEAVFTYARAVAMCHQSALLRLALVQAGLAAAPLLLRDVQPTVARLAFYQARRPVELPTHEAEAMTGDRREKEAVDDACFRGLCHHVPWHVYYTTFWLLLHQLAVLHTHVVQALQHVENKLDLTLDARTQVPSTALHYVIDNLHQVYAAEYHICFYMLEQLWRVYLDADGRTAVRAARTAGYYLQHDTATDLDERIVQRADEIGEAKCPVFSDSTDCFLSLEAYALHLAKRLASEDGIRVKYWRHEVRVLLTRSYE